MGKRDFTECVHCGEIAGHKPDCSIKNVTMGKSSEDGVREFFVYEGLRNCSPLIFVYKEPQKIKQAAPENFVEYHVIEKSYADRLKAEIDKLNNQWEVKWKQTLDSRDLLIRELGTAVKALGMALEALEKCKRIKVNGYWFESQVAADTLTQIKSLGIFPVEGGDEK